MSDLLERVAFILCERERWEPCVCEDKNRTADEMQAFVGCSRRIMTASLVLAEVQKPAKDEDAA